jgi:hypothetical protein
MMLQAISNYIFFARPISIESRYDLEESERRLSHALRPYMDRASVDGYVTVDDIVISARHGSGGSKIYTVFKARFVHRERRIFLEGSVGLNFMSKFFLLCCYAAFLWLLVAAGSMPFEHGVVIAVITCLVALPWIALVRLLADSMQRSIRSASLQALQAGPACDVRY